MSARTNKRRSGQRATSGAKASSDTREGKLFLSLKGKLALFALIGLILIGAVAAVGLVGLQQTQRADEQVQVVNAVYRDQHLLERSREEVERSVELLLRSMAGDPSVDAVQTKLDLDAGVAHLLGPAASIVGLPTDLQQALRVQHDLVQAYGTQAQAVVTQAQADLLGAQATFAGMEPTYFALVNAQDAVSELFSQTLEQKLSVSNDVRRAATERIRLTLAVAVAATAALTLAIRATIIRPLNQLADAARTISNGDFNVRATRTGSDELGSLAVAINRMAANMQNYVKRKDIEVEEDTFAIRLSEEFEMTASERGLLDVVSHAMQLIAPSTPMELLLRDRKHDQMLVRSAVSSSSGPAGCSVNTTYGCPAIREGHLVAFESSRTAHCAKLNERRGPAVSAVCVPVTFMDRPIGVVHAVTPLSEPLRPVATTQMETLARQSGNQIQTRRNHEATQQLATIDGLTGLRNRRTIEEELRSAINSGGLLSVVLADIDHFKRLNDSAGHEQGDRALQLFSRSMEQSFREADLCGRYGGEEFVIVLPGATLQMTIEAIDRFRENLARASAEAGLPMITASFGVVDNSMGTSLEALLRLADAAMYRAKQEGRNRANVADGRDMAVVRAGQDRRAGAPSTPDVASPAPSSPAAVRVPGPPPPPPPRVAAAPPGAPVGAFPPPKI